MFCRICCLFTVIIQIVFMNDAIADIYPNFKDYPIPKFYKKSHKFPDFNGRDRWAKDYKTKIKQGIESGPNFAGEYSIIEIGCGTGCAFVLIVDNKTGAVLKSNLPEGGERYPNIWYTYKVDSSLIISVYDNLSRDGYKKLSCVLNFYVLKNKSVKKIFSKNAMPPNDAEGYCNDKYIF